MAKRDPHLMPHLTSKEFLAAVDPVRQFKIAGRPLGRPRTTNTKRDARIRALRERGLSYAAIAKEIGLTKTGVWQIATGYDGYARRKEAKHGRSRQAAR